MKLACWNIRGLHKPLKQRSVQSLVGTHKIDIFGILESNFDEKALLNMMRLCFRGMQDVQNFLVIAKGRIFVVWNPLTVAVNVFGM